MIVHVIWSVENKQKPQDQRQQPNIGPHVYMNKDSPEYFALTHDIAAKDAEIF